MLNFKDPYSLTLSKLSSFPGEPGNSNQDLVHNTGIISLVIEAKYPIQSHRLLIHFRANSNAMSNDTLIFGSQYIYLMGSARPPFDFSIFLDSVALFLQIPYKLRFGLKFEGLLDHFRAWLGAAGQQYL